MTKNILLVEYDEATVRLIKDLLPPPLFELTVANDGETAKRHLAGKQFDMMITAAMLPRFHGFNLALNVAQENPLIKIIIISAIYKGFYYKHQAMSQYRADDFFEKPLDKDAFRNRVLELLNIPVSEFHAATHAATTQVPGFDTAKIPTLGKLEEEEEKKLSADDIFGDLLKNIDKVPQFKIDLNEGQAAKSAKPDGVPFRPPAPFQSLQTKKEPEVTREGGKPDPGQTVMAPPAAAPRPGPAREARKAASVSQSISDDLDSLRQTVKKQIPETNMRKIEDDIARRFEDTLSGLGLGLTASKPAPKPAAAVKAEEKPAAQSPSPVEPAAVVPEKTSVTAEQKPFKEEIIELGEEALQKEVTVEPAVDSKKIVAKEEPKPEKKTAPVENPNEVGDYVLLGLIARGGMAEIYKAKKKGVKGFEKIIAIKKILSGYGEDDKYIEMLVDEAKIAAELSHPNIIQIYDLGRKDNYYFIAMEYVLGKDLRETQSRLREKDQWFPEEISLFLCIKILEALNYAHKAKDSHGHALEIVHRDVSPPNILISYNGDVKLTDFGISKASIKMHQTISGALKGKLLYMSPEQARGEGTIDCRSDLYSVGVVLFELLTSRKLFLDTSEMGVLKKVQNGEILNPREINPNIDPALEKIILKSLNKAPDKRYQSAAAMIADLETFMVKKYNYLPGPVQLSHFIYQLFEKDIVRDGIKVDLKPLPEKPLLREAPKAQPAPPEPAKPVTVFETKVSPPTVVAAAEKAPAPRASADKAPGGVVHIDFDEDKIVPIKSTAKAPAPEIKKNIPLFNEIEEPKRKFPLWAAVLVLAVMAAAALGYFMFIKKPAANETQTVAKPAVVEKTAAQPETAETQAKQQPAVDPQVLALEKLKQKEAELEKQLQDAAAATAATDAVALKKKQQDEKRAKQAEIERSKKEEADRLQKEEQDRLQREEELRRQAEADRLAKEAQDKKKADELKELERKRVKEGDVVPLPEVDREPQAVSKPDPVIPTTIMASIMANQSVLFNILVNQNGDVEVARLMHKTSNSQLNSILIATIQTWKFTPAMKNGVRVKVWKTISLIIKK
ncbi:MAG: protein kinase [Candidatus Aminicenantes bacterium]|nr:protein kinase [Candidatus Aminicenantes bacterium]